MFPLSKPKTFWEAYSEGPSTLNALRQQEENVRKSQLFNQFYGPEKEADIAHQQLVNQFYPELTKANIGHLDATTRNALANAAFQEFQNANPFYNTPEGQLTYMEEHPEKYGRKGGNAMIPPESKDAQVANLVNSLSGGQRNELKGIMNQPLSQPSQTPQLANATNLTRRGIEADIANKEAQAKQRNMGFGGRGSALLATQQGVRNQISQEIPGINEAQANQAANAYMDGELELPDGTPLPYPSAQIKQLIKSGQKQAGMAPTPAMKDKAANFAQLSKEIETVEKEFLPALQAFAGGKGKLRYANESRKMALGQPVSEEFRKYDTFIKNRANLLMDKVRLALKTSVVPPYVTQTLGPLANPQDGITTDAEQVKRRFEDFKAWARDESSFWNDITGLKFNKEKGGEDEIEKADPFGLRKRLEEIQSRKKS